MEYITICKLMRTHGVKGYIKAKPLTHDLNRHKLLNKVLLKKINGEELFLELEDSRLANTIWLLKFKGYDSPESVVHFVNGDLMIEESERILPPDGEYYIDDLIGFKIRTEDLVEIGRVTDVVELSTINAFDVRFDENFQQEFSKKNILVPWIHDCILEINEKDKFIVCDKDYLIALCPNEHKGSLKKGSTK